MRRSILFGVFLALISVSNGYSQEYRITDSSCIGWGRGPDGRDIPAATISASVSDWKPYVTMEEGSRLINAILREGIPRCVQRGSKPLVFDVRISADSVSMRYMLRARYYAFDRPGAQRLELVANNIGEFQQAERATQQKKIDEHNAARAAAEKAQREAQLVDDINRQAAEEKRSRDQADQTTYKEHLSKAKEMERAADEAAAARAKAKPADGFCMWSCDPLEAHGRQVLKNQITTLFPTAVVIKNFVLTQGAKMTLAGSTIFEMRYTVDLDFPIGFAARPTAGFWNEVESVERASSGFMQLNELMRLTQRTKGPKWWDSASYSATGVMRFLKTDRGWMGPDEKLYK